MPTNLDFSDMLAALSARDARFLVVGAHAVMRFTEPRYTKDLDIWVAPSPENAERVFAALQDFGAPLAGIVAAEFAVPGTIFQIGVAPNRIDVITAIDGVEFDEAWASRVPASYGGQSVFVPSIEILIRNKRASGRPQDLLDVTSLERAVAWHRSGRPR